MRDFWRALMSIRRLLTRIVMRQKVSQCNSQRTSLAIRRLPLATTLVVVFLHCWFVSSTLGQTETASIAGRVSDPSGAVIPGAVLHLVNIDKGTETSTKTNGSGVYVIPGVVPGRYRMQVEHDGFKVANLVGLSVNIQDNLEENFKLEVGSVSESVTVDATGLNINTTNADVSTVVDRKFVESMPLNGRSFQSLILLAPGAITNSPQSAVSSGFSGEFSINGQRTDANYFTIDGVSANNQPVAGTSAAASSGALASTTALGSTQALVSVDALQEFRINTSTYSAESGRQPGGQIQFETRSGTNQFHGTAFDYLRNTVFDANNWFNNYGHVAKPAERQNDFGGVLGGPVSVPRLYSGKDRAFFFFSYEGLRLSQPEAATISYVPTDGSSSNGSYSNLRSTAPSAIQPVLNDFPLPNCTVAQDAQCVDDSAEGLSPYLISTSLPSSIDAVSARGDYVATPWLRLFFRYGDTQSSAIASITTYETAESYGTHTYTLGADTTPLGGGSFSNQFRLNYSPSRDVFAVDLTGIGGGTLSDLRVLQGLQKSVGQTTFELVFPHENAIMLELRLGNPQDQWNLVDTATWLHGRHSIRFGVDYRRTTSHINTSSLTRYPYTVYEYTTPASVQSNSPLAAEAATAARQDPAFTNFSSFIQDEWKVRPRLGLSLGMRWDINPPPTTVSGVPHSTVNGSFGNPTSLALAPAGTPLYSTTYYNLAPRVGMAAILHDRPGRETVMRLGGGIYYDLGQQYDDVFGGGFGPGEGTQKLYGSAYSNPVSFPLPLNLINIPISGSLVPPYAFFYVVSRNLQLPYSYQWNASMEQSLGSSQSVTVGYVGSNGRKLLQLNQLSLAKLNPAFTTVGLFQNGLSSSYNALQAQFRRRLADGLQGLASYTWSHALDFESLDDGVLPYERGNSDFDIRNSFTAALSYDLQSNSPDRMTRALLSGWGADLRLTFRTAFPVEVKGPFLTDASSGTEYYGLLNYNSAAPLYLKKSGLPGGRIVNSAAFSAPLVGQQGNSPRNFVRGFGENEANVALRREFAIYEQLHMLFRAEAFNVLNHPNLGAINATCGTPPAGETCTNATFGQATSTLSNSLGGLTPIYQQGGPRSLQFALKLLF